MLSSLIKKVWCTCTFLDHFREAYEQLLCDLLQYNRFRCYSLLQRNSLLYGFQNFWSIYSLEQMETAFFLLKFKES